MTGTADQEQRSGEASRSPHVDFSSPVSFLVTGDRIDRDYMRKTMPHKNGHCFDGV